MPILEMLGDANFRWVAVGTFLLGLSSGVLGVFALLRRRSLMADVLSHTALPGVAMAFMLTQTKNIELLLLGAVIAGLLGSWCVDVITRNSRIKEDTAQALVLTVFFGFGVVLLTRIAASGAAGQSGLDRFLFGQAASLVGRDIQVIGVVAAVLILAVVLFFKELKLLCFDPGFGQGLGYPMTLLDRGLMLLVILAVSVGLQAVGVVLMSAMLITPAAAARYWTNRLGTVVLLSGLFGGLSGLAGTAVSMMGARLPTGPLIVLAASALFLLSLALGSQRGLIPRALRQICLRRRVAAENTLRWFYEYDELCRAEGARDSALPATAVARRLGWSPLRTRLLLWAMARDGLLMREAASAHAFASPGSTSQRPAARFAAREPLWRLSPLGFDRARQVVRNHRLWEIFLTHEAELAVDHVDRDADDIEHFLPPEVVRELEKRGAELYGVSAFPPSVHSLREGDE